MYQSLSLILDFIANHVNLQNFSYDEEDLFEQIKKQTLELEDVVLAREKIIIKSAKNDEIYEKLIICPGCLKKFLFSEGGENNCLFCYYEDTSEKVADAYISNVLRISAYSCIKDGGEYPLYECPECAENAFVFNYNQDTCFCFSCGFSPKVSNIKFCSECGKVMCSQDGESMLICDNCLHYKINEDD